MDNLAQIPPVVLLLLAAFFAWLATTLGAAVVFCFKDKELNKRALDIMLGVSAGIMVAAALWSLTLPAIDLAGELWPGISWLLPSLGFLAGGLFITLTSIILDHKLPHANAKKRSILLFTTVTMHNIPEGLAIGVGFSSFAMGLAGSNLLSAIMITVGIGIQNFPDGLAVSVPLYRDGMRKGKAFFLGQASGLVEPIAAIIGFFITMAVRSALPFLLTFAAGAMIIVVIGELIPDIDPKNRSWSNIGFVIGFVAMMIMDLTLTW